MHKDSIDPRYFILSSNRLHPFNHMSELHGCHATLSGPGASYLSRPHRLWSSSAFDVSRLFERLWPSQPTLRDVSSRMVIIVYDTVRSGSKIKIGFSPVYHPFSKEVRFLLPQVRKFESSIPTFSYRECEKHFRTTEEVKWLSVPNDLLRNAFRSSLGLSSWDNIHSGAER